MYCDVNNLCGWAMLQKLSVDNFNFQFGKDFIENYNEIVTNNIFLKLIRLWWRIFSWSGSSISWKITWPPQRFTLFVQQNEIERVEKLAW